MESKAKIISFSPHYAKHTTTLVMELETTDTDTLASLEKHKEGFVRVDVKTWREKRSLNANALFYLMVDRLADALRVSKPYIHNLMLRKYGQLQRIDGRPIWVILPETDEVLKKVDEDDSLHLKPTSEVKEGKDGKMYRTYLMLKGSHELDSKGMSVLIDGVIDEAKQAGVNTTNSEEVRKIKEMWGVDVT